MQNLIKILLIFLYQSVLAEVNQFELQDYHRSIKPIDRNLATALGTHRESINSLSARLEQFQEKFNRIGVEKDLTTNFSTAKIENEYAEPSKTPFLETSPKSRGTSKVVIKADTNDKFLNEPFRGYPELGFYILPFMALQSSGNFQSETFQTEIEQDVGFSSGWKMGVESPHFFIEGEFSYSRNKLKGSVVIPLLPPSFNPIKVDGESEGFGVLLNAGGRFALSDRISVMLGAGFGAVNQEIGFVIASTLVEEEDTLLTYQLFSGLNYDFSDQFRLGLRYRWMKVGEMKDFSDRELHLAELSMGYVF